MIGWFAQCDNCKRLEHIETGARDPYPYDAPRHWLRVAPAAERDGPQRTYPDTLSFCSWQCVSAWAITEAAR
jgi:hypothetical protein